MPPKGSSGTSHSSPGSSRSSAPGGPRPSRPSGPSTSSHSSRPSGSSANRPGTIVGSGSQGHANMKPNARPRVNQPKGYRSSSGLGMFLLYGMLHDYAYYPEDFTGSDGKTYRRGYYDENGNYYKNVVVENQETELECPYCGTRNKIIWKEGVLPKCPNCGGEYDLVKEKEGTSTSYSQTSTQSQSTSTVSSAGSTDQKKASPIRYLIIGVILLALVPSLLRGCGFFRSDAGQTQLSSVSTTDAALSGGNSLYVQEIGRTCKLDGDYWYDEKTQCWFWLNTNLSPAQWQYWYEDISSDYGDYGWMEYDSSEKRWYIETYADVWEVLPSSYSTSKLWHIDS